MKRIFALFLIVTLSGCAAGFDRGAIRQRLAHEKLEVTDKDIQKALETKPQLRFPIKLAVHLSSASFYPHHRYESGHVGPASDWRWSVKDKEEIESWATKLKDQGIVSDIFVISDITVAGTDTKSIRLAAAKHGADAVITVKGISQVDSYVNPLCILNILILPGWIVPASHRDALLVLQGAMLDVGNGYLYLTVESEGEAKTMGPSFSIEDEKAIEKAKQLALNDFGIHIAKRLASLKGT